MKGRISRQLVVELDFGIHKNDFHRDLPCQGKSEW